LLSFIASMLSRFFTPPATLLEVSPVSWTNLRLSRAATWSYRPFHPQTCAVDTSSQYSLQSAARQEPTSGLPDHRRSSQTGNNRRPCLRLRRRRCRVVTTTTVRREVPVFKKNVATAAYRNFTPTPRRGSQLSR
jgi:hypothetical protein